jgi:hypothetical protein
MTSVMHSCRRLWGLLFLLVVSIGFLLAVWFDVSPLLRGPEPYPPEWQWPFRAGRSLEVGWLGLVSSLGLLSLLVISGLELAGKSPRGAAVLLLAGATLLGLGLQVGLVALEEDRSAVVTLTRRTMDRWHTGYYGVAVSPLASDPAAFLRNHADILATLSGKMEHVPTRPPGAVLYYRGVLAICEASPPLTRGLLGIMQRAGLEVPAREGSRAASRLATALLGPLLLMLLGAAACWPVAILARTAGIGPLEAARAGVLWCALPGPTLLVPQMDQLLTFLTAMAVALLSVSLARSGRGFKTTALAAGLFGGLAVFVSYGGAIHVTFGGLIALALFVDRPAAARSVLPVLALSVAAALAFTALPMLVGHDPIESFRTAMSTHFGEYTLRRSYRSWLLFNLWDLAVFVSIPVALLGVYRLVGSLTAFRRNGWWGSHMSVQRAQIATGLLLLLFNASGVVRGEIGRSWMPIMPFLLVAATTGLRHTASTVKSEGSAPADLAAGQPMAEVLILGLLLLAHCWVLRLCWGL